MRPEIEALMCAIAPVAPEGLQSNSPPKRRLEPVFEQFRCDVPAGVKDAQDQDPPALDGKGNADAAVANNPQPRHDLDPLGARRGNVDRSRQWWRIPVMKSQEIAGGARPAIS